MKLRIAVIKTTNEIAEAEEFAWWPDQSTIN